MKNFFSIILTTLLLQGCIAGAFMAGGAAGSTVATDKRSLKVMAADENISYQAARLIASNPDLLNNAHIVVVSYNGVVLMVGQAPTPEQRSQAVQIVQGIPKIKRIFNDITIGAPTSAFTRSEDAAITANVKARMLATTNLHSSQFKIVTENHVVYIMGLASRKQADIAGLVARNSSGVKKVVKLVEYTYDDETVPQ